MVAIPVEEDEKDEIATVLLPEVVSEAFMIKYKL